MRKHGSNNMNTKFAAALLLGFLLSSCGQKGPLYIQEKQGEQEQAQSADQENTAGVENKIGNTAETDKNIQQP